MPFRAFIAFANDHMITVASTLGMGMVSGFCYILGTTPAPEAAGVVLNSSTQVQGSPYALFAIVTCVVSATWIVASGQNRNNNAIIEAQRAVTANGEAGKRAWKDLSEKLEEFGDRLDLLNNKREATEKQLVAVQTHIEECPYKHHNHKQ